MVKGKSSNDSRNKAKGENSKSKTDYKNSKKSKFDYSIENIKENVSKNSEKDYLLNELLKGYKKEFQDILLEEEKKGFYIHLVVFLFIILTLFLLLNSLGIENKEPILYLIAGWSLALFIHFLEAFYWAKDRIKEKEDIAELKFRKELSKKLSK